MAECKNNSFDDNQEIFIKRLKEITKGKSRQKIADEVGLARQTIDGYVNGKSTPNFIDCARIAKTYGVSLDWLCGISDVKSPDADLQGVCDYLGISEHVVKTFRTITKEYDNKRSSAVFDALVPDENNAVKFYLGFKNALITLAEADLKNNINGDTNLYSRSHDDCYTPIGMSISELWKNQIQAAFNLLYAEIINNLKSNPVSFF